MNENIIRPQRADGRIEKSFLLLLIDVAIDCGAEDAQLPLRLDLAQAARALLDAYIADDAQAESVARLTELARQAAREQVPPPGEPPEWVTEVIEGAARMKGPA